MSVKKYLSFIALVLSLSLLCFTSGCVIFATGMQAYQDSGLSLADRRILFEKHTKLFFEGVSAQDFSRANQYISDESRNKIRSDLKRELKDTKWVDFSIDETLEEKDGYRLVAFITIRKFSNRDYLVKEVKERQTWTFSVGDVWRLDERSVVRPALN